MADGRDPSREDGPEASGSPPRVVAADAPGALDAAGDALRAGRVVAIPTETVYGLAALPTPDALARVVAVKGRAPDKGLPVLIDSVEQAQAIAVVPPAARAIASALWPGPVTLVLATRPEVSLPPLVTGDRPTVALRLPDHAVPRALARALGPLALTSANRSGEPDATTAEGVVRALGDGAGESVPLVLDAGPAPGGVPSTIVAVADDGSVAILRAGAVSEAEIRAALASRG